MEPLRPGMALEVDRLLCQEIEQLMDAVSIHAYTASVGAYRTAAKDYNLTGDQGMAEVFRDAERELRILLIKLRERKFLGIDWWEGRGKRPGNWN